jgi:hypothetical protein
MHVEKKFAPLTDSFAIRTITIDFLGAERKMQAIT